MESLLMPFIITFLAGLSTLLGSVIFFSNGFCQKKHIGFFMGLSAGVMIYISFMELLPDAIEIIGFNQTNLFFFTGIFFMAIIDFLIPHHYIKQRARQKKVISFNLMSTGIVITIGLFIHNIPEGIAVFISSTTDIRLGLLLAFAIAIHNIPEGIAISAPIYHATKNKMTALKYSAFAGLAEPLGGIVAYLLLKNHLNENTLAYIFALVAGIMVYISFDELLPFCFRQKQAHHSMIGIIIGMTIVFFGLMLF